MIDKDEAKRIATEFAARNNWPWSDDIAVTGPLIPLVGGYRVVARVPQDCAKVEVRINASGKPTGGRVRYNRGYGAA